MPQPDGRSGKNAIDGLVSAQNLVDIPIIRHFDTDNFCPKIFMKRRESFLDTHSPRIFVLQGELSTGFVMNEVTRVRA